MKKLLALLGMAMIIISFAVNTPAIAVESSSPDPNAKSGLQACDGHPNYGNRIDFENVAAGTIINTQYLGQGVKFGAAAGGPVTIATTDGARPLDGNILTGQPVFTGDVYASFWIGALKACVTHVGATVGYCDNVGAVTMKAYNINGVEVGSYTNTTIGVEFFTISAPGIHMVKFFMGSDPAGSDIDCFTYDSLWGPGINKDATNIGTSDAYDVSVVLKGIHSTTWRYMGGWGAVFSGYFETKYPNLVTGPNTKLTWNNLNGIHAPIHPKPTEIYKVHIGWRIDGPDPIGEVLDMFWTDINGDRLTPCSQVSQTDAHLYYPEIGVVVLTWPNHFQPDTCPPTNLTVSDIKYLIALTPLDMNVLNRYNDSLNAALIPVPGTWTIAPGDSFSLQLPAFVPAGSYVVLFYKVTSPESSAEIGDYVQYGPMVLPSGDIPTLTEWGMIIFGVVLLGFISWVFLKRRKVIGVRL